MKTLIQLFKRYFCKPPTCLSDEENKQSKTKHNGSVEYPKDSKRPNLFIDSDVSLLFKDEATLTTLGEFGKMNTQFTDEDERIALWKEQNSYRKRAQCPFETSESL